MIRTFYYGLFIFVACMMTACKKYLDIVPRGKIIPGRTADYRLLLDQVSSNGKSNGFVKSFSTDVLMGDDMKVTAFSASFYKAADQNALMFAEHIYQDAESDPDWEALYNQVYVTNFVIAEVMNSTGGTEEEKNKLLAEAKVHRAYAYFILVNLYAKQYDAAAASTDPGVPLRVQVDFEEKLPRAPVQQVYDFIIKDLNDALNKLPATPELNYNFRPVEAAVYTLLARVYLQMNKPDAALVYADSGLKRYNTLIDYNTLAANPALPGTLQYPIGLQNKEVLLLKSVVSPTSFFYAANSLISLYDTQDLRKPAMYASDALFGMSDGYFCMEWSGRTPAKGPSTAEAYLLRAECHARLGHIAAALSDLNYLRSYRYKSGSNYTLSAVTKEEVLALVKQERRRELAFKGYRFFDIRRYNKFDNDNISVTHVLNNTAYILSPESPRSVLPIARKYIDLNPEIVQNPR